MSGLSYSIDIGIDENYIKGKDHFFKPEEVEKVLDRLNIKVRFISETNKKEYIKKEYAFTYNEMRALAAAWTPEERIDAKVRLYAARREFYNDYFKAEKNDEKKV